VIRPVAVGHSRGVRRDLRWCRAGLGGQRFCSRSGRRRRGTGFRHGDRPAGGVGRGAELRLVRRDLAGPVVARFVGLFHDAQPPALPPVGQADDTFAEQLPASAPMPDVGEKCGGGRAPSGRASYALTALLVLGSACVTWGIGQTAGRATRDDQPSRGQPPRDPIPWRLAPPPRHFVSVPPSDADRAFGAGEQIRRPSRRRPAFPAGRASRSATPDLPPPGRAIHPARATGALFHPTRSETAALSGRLSVASSLLPAASLGKGCRGSDPAARTGPWALSIYRS
jgi:hypothetical protein